MKFIMVSASGDDLVEGTLNEIKVWCKYSLTAMLCYDMINISWVESDDAPGMVIEQDDTELCILDTEQTRLFILQLLATR